MSSQRDSARDVAERARDLNRQICQAREVTIVCGAVLPDFSRFTNPARFRRWLPTSQRRAVCDGIRHRRLVSAVADAGGHALP